MMDICQTAWSFIADALKDVLLLQYTHDDVARAFVCYATRCVRRRVISCYSGLRWCSCGTAADAVWFRAASNSQAARGQDPGLPQREDRGQRAMV